jgi:integrase
VGDRSITVGGLLDLWLSAYDAAPNTLSTVASVVKTHLRPTLGRIKVLDLSVDDVNRLLFSMKRKGLSVDTCIKTRSVLVMVLNYAEANDLAPRNVAAKTRIKRPRDDGNAEETWLTPAEGRRLLDSEPLKSNRYATLYTFLLGTGVRVGEALALQWKDVDLVKGTAHIRQNLALGKIGPTKTKQSIRHIGLPVFVVAALKGSKGLPNAMVFPGTAGKPMSYKTADRNFKVIVAAAKLDPAKGHCHATRHCYITTMLDIGTPPLAVAAQTGDTLTTILRVYAHHLPTQVGVVTENAQKAFG